MKKPKFSLADLDETVVSLVDGLDKRGVAVWAKACAERVLNFYEEAYPEDPRPRRALEKLQAWINTGEFRMSEIRAASLAAHAAAREVGEDSPARSAARAAGQAVATAHVKTHAIAAANYALQAIHRASDAQDAEEFIAREQEWQIQYLRKLGSDEQ